MKEGGLFHLVLGEAVGKSCQKVLEMGFSRTVSWKISISLEEKVRQ